MSTVSYVPFSKLVAGDEINARLSGGKEGLEQLAASIEAKGLIQPLAVRPADGASGRYEIIDGRRRYQAMARLVKEKRLKRDEQVPVLVRNEDNRDARESSLMANVVRLPMHAVDQFEVMAQLFADGLSHAELAARFGIAERTVRQHLALGQLAPEVRVAWRKGKIDADTAKAFAVCDDQARQAEVLAKLGARVSPWNVRHELDTNRERVDQSDELALVGEAAYRAAGGRIEEDLFTEARYLLDVGLVKRLADEQLEAKCNELRAAGWAWADVERDGLTAWDCQHVLGARDFGEETGEDFDFTPEQRARSGCLVAIERRKNAEGGGARIDVLTGLIRPNHLEDGAGDDQVDLEDLTSQPAAVDVSRFQKPEPEPAGPFDISQALLETITAAQTTAAASVLARDRDLALRVAIATLESGRPYDAPSKLSIGQDAHERPYSAKGFAKLLKSVSGDVLPVLAERFAKLVAASLQLTVKSGTKQIEAVRPFVDALDADEYLAAMREAFAAGDYFTRARKETAIAALEEMHAGGHRFGLTGREDLERMKKGELAEWAAEQAKACGWLPPELRNGAYALVVEAPPAKRKARVRA